MNTRLPDSQGQFKNRRVVCIGDSLTLAYYFGFMPRQYFPTVLENLLASAGCFCKSRNFGIGGHTSGQIASRAAALNYFETPDIAVIWAGTNDFGSSGVVAPISGGLTNPSGTTAQFVANIEHGMESGDSTVIAGASPSAYNGTVSVTVIDRVTFSYTAGGSSLATATGTITGTPAQISTTGNSCARSQANIQAAIKCAKFGAKGFVTGQANLPVGKNGQRFVVMSDTDATGGVPAITPGQLPTISGAGGSLQTVWEYRLPLTGNAGWGRVANASTPATNCGRIVVVGQHYLNWSSGGDNQSTATVYANYNATNGLRFAQGAAVGAEAYGPGTVVFCDLYGFMLNRIATGLDTQGNAGWHVADGNVHLNAYGQSLVATALYQTIAKAGWRDALSV